MRSNLLGMGLCSAVASVAVAGSAGAAVLAAWDFQTTTYGGTRADSVLILGSYTTPLPRQFVANFGSGTLFLDGTNGSSDFYMPTTDIYGEPAATARGDDGRYTEYNVTRGTAVNADTSIGMSTDSAPQISSLSVIGGGFASSSERPTNGKGLVLKFDASGYQSLSISYATRRGNSSGFTSQTLEWSTDGVNWGSIGQWTSFSSTSWGAATFSGISGLSGAASAYIRISFDGSTGQTGSNGLDNIIISGSVIPAPGAVALVGVAGLIGGRRRKA